MPMQDLNMKDLNLVIPMILIQVKLEKQEEYMKFQFHMNLIKAIDVGDAQIIINTLFACIIEHYKELMYYKKYNF